MIVRIITLTAFSSDLTVISIPIEIFLIVLVILVILIILIISFLVIIYRVYRCFIRRNLQIKALSGIIYY